MMNMDPYLFTRALVIGFSVAAPVGPIGILCIEKTLSEGRSRGLITGFGAATADSVYSAVAAFGITAISGLLVAQRLSLALIGGIILFYIGLRLLWSKPRIYKPSDDKGSNLHIYAMTFGLTMTNPMTIISFAAFYAGIGFGGGSGDYLSATVFVVGTFLGSAIWWIILSSFVAIFRERITPKALDIVNKAAGLVIIGFGAYVLFSGIANYWSS